MPLKGFYCPDGYIIDKVDCYKQCRLEHRCLTLPTLKMIGQEREWAGKASTTQLLDGTLYQYLKLTKDYWIKPKSKMFAILGTQVHASLEEQAKLLGLPAEVALSIDRDIFDLLETDEQGKIGMTDYKTWGSFKVAKALGIVEDGKQPDPSGALYLSSGKWGKAGSPKMIPKFKQDPNQADNMEANLQLNRYRIMLEEQHNIHLAYMQLQVIVRDGNTYMADGRGVTEEAYLILIPMLENDMVKGFFQYKEDNLKLAFAGLWSEPCNESECWEGIRCKDYCEVWNHCVKGIGVHSIMNMGKGE